MVLKGYSMIYRNASVTSGKAVHAFQADFLPFPTIALVVSDPVYAWKAGVAFDLRSPSNSHKTFFLRGRGLGVNNAF